MICKYKKWIWSDKRNDVMFEHREKRLLLQIDIWQITKLLEQVIDNKQKRMEGD